MKLYGCGVLQVIIWSNKDKITSKSFAGRMSVLKGKMKRRNEEQMQGEYEHQRYKRIIKRER